MKGLEDKNVLVTGGTSGIGQAIAVRFASEGTNVAVNYRKHIEDASQTDEMIHEALEKCVDEVKCHGVNHILVQADVSVEDEVAVVLGASAAVRRLGLHHTRSLAGDFAL